jgi:hypothetical protein
MRELDLRLTELSDYLKISRVTLYRYIELYEDGKRKGIERRALSLFDYIENAPNIGKKNVMSYIINMVSEENRGEGSIVSAMVEYIKSKNRSEEKIALIRTIIEKESLDALIPYINNCIAILEKEDMSEEETVQVSKYVIFYRDVTSNKPINITEQRETAKILKGWGHRL